MPDRFHLPVALILLLCCILGGCYSDDTTSEWPVISIREPLKDFGKVVEGQTLDHSFFISNQGRGPLRILNVKTTVESMTAFPLAQVLAPGQSSEIRVIFATEDLWGKQEQKILLISNDPARLETVIQVKAEIAADFDVKPKIIRAKLDSKSGKWIGSTVLKNVSDHPILVTSLESESKRVAASLQPPFSLPAQLDPGQFAIIDVALDFHATRNSGKDDLTIRLEGRVKPILIPVKIHAKKAGEY